MSMQDIKEEMSPMVTVINNLTNDGYTTQFKASETGITSMKTEQCFSPQDVQIRHFYRFEGESSPDDSSIIYAIETNTGEKGTLVDSYGAYADPHIEKFIKEVEAIKK